MNQIKIDIIQLGESKYRDEWKFINKLMLKGKSKLFKINNVKKVSLPKSDFWGYSDITLRSLIKHDDSADITLCFIDYPLEGNFFVRRIGDNVGVATFYETSSIFKGANVDLKNFILLTIYETITLSQLDIDKSQDALIDFHHDETRGCLFDMCGLKEDVIISAMNPKICFECEPKLRKVLLHINYIDLLKKELKQIKKPRYYRITDWVKKHPIFAIVIATSSSLLLNIIASLIYDVIQNYNILSMLLDLFVKS